MNELSRIFMTVPGMVYAVIAVVVLVCGGFVLFLYLYGQRFYRELEKAGKSRISMKQFINSYNSKLLMRRTSVLIKAARVLSPDIIKYTGLERAWIKKVKTRGSASAMKHLLEFSSEKGLFCCFEAALHNPGLYMIFTDWLKDKGDIHVLSQIAVSARGADFDGEEALKLLSNRLSELREMTGDPRWEVRVFAYRILFHDDDKKTIRALWDGFNDPYPLIRRVLIESFETDDSKKMYQTLFNLYTGDPVFEVRKAARERLTSEYEDFYNLDDTDITGTQGLHVLELLEESSGRDKKIAMKFLESDDLELRYPAAEFLERTGKLNSLFLNVRSDDTKQYQRTLKLLRGAAEVNVCGFLGQCGNTSNPASLELAAELLTEFGERKYIYHLAKNVFALYADARPVDSLYEKTVNCIIARGNNMALALLNTEIMQNRYNNERMECILPGLPEGTENVFYSGLLALMKDEQFTYRDILVEKMSEIAKEAALSDLIDILKKGREEYPHVVRISALKALGMLGYEFCLQFILENLSVLPVDEARVFSRTLERLYKRSYRKKVKRLFETPDENVRASIIASLPVESYKEFSSYVREGTRDASPIVRVASMWAMVEKDDGKSVSQNFDLIRDPVASVRDNAAAAIAQYGSDAALEHLRETIKDPNEVESVKVSAIRGLGKTQNTQSIDILIDFLDSGHALGEFIIEAMARKTDKNEIEVIAKRMKDAGPKLRDSLADIFSLMGSESETAIIKLLHEDIASLKPVLADILDKTGYIEHQIRRLSHRDKNVRSEAAHVLSVIQNRPAFRGIVMAARDPDEEVRVKVVKALERLHTKEGKKILDSLLEDPDAKVRTYTKWALERLEVKEL